MLVLLVPGVGMGAGTAAGASADTYPHVGVSRGVIKPNADNPGQAD